MVSLAILTCVTGEPDVLRNTAASISPFLSQNLKWIIKFSDKSNEVFANSFSAENIEIKLLSTRLLLGSRGWRYYLARCNGDSFAPTKG